MEERGSGTTYGLSNKGWVDTQLFQGWLTEHFLPNAVGSRPLLLLLDGHMLTSAKCAALLQE